MPLDPVTFRELPVIQKIIDDETWLEGERRGVPVSPDDPIVIEHVCDVVMRIGAQLRAELTAALPAPEALVPAVEVAPIRANAA